MMTTPERLPNSFMRDLSCTLTEDELKVRSQDLATTIDDRIEVEFDKKKANDKWNTEMKDMGTRIVHLAQVVRTRTEIRPVECLKEINLEERETTIVRRDTGEAIETRGSTTKELETAGQRSMFSGSGQKE